MRRIATLLGALAATAFVTMSLQAATPPSATALTNCSVSDWSIDGEEANFLAIINEYRAANGVGPLALNDHLNRAAAWMASDMGANDIFGHTDSIGRGPWQRIVDCGYPVAGGENLAAGTNRDSASGAFELFRGSPSHNENMLLARYGEIGIARVYAPGTRYTWYWATTFGTLSPAAAPAPAATQPPPPAPTAPPAPPAAASAPQPRLPVTTVQLTPGANLVEWAGPEASPAEIVANGKIEMLYAWDIATQRWVRYGPKLPPYLQTMGNVVAGDRLWVIAESPLTLDMLH